MAEHVVHGQGRPWSGTPEDLVELAIEGKRIMRSAAHDDGDGHRCLVRTRFKGQRSSRYDSPEDFLANFRPSEISDLKGVTLSFSNRDVSLSSAVDLVPGLWIRPFVTASSTDPALADGVANQLTNMFSGRSRFGRQGLRRPGEVTLLRGLRTRAGSLVTLAVTVAISVAVGAVVTFYLTKVLK